MKHVSFDENRIPHETCFVNRNLINFITFELLIFTYIMYKKLKITYDLAT